MPRYVILHHVPGLAAQRPEHWDLMLETDGVLRTWALAAPPDVDGAVIAESLPDHRLAYLDYEGPVSGDRGHVARWDRGEYAVLSASPTELVVSVVGTKLRGTLRIQRSERQWCVTLALNDAVGREWGDPSPSTHVPGP